MGIEKKKLRILSKLAESGIDTEKKVMALDKYALVDFCLSNGLQLLDTKTILDLQKAIKERKVYSFLTGGEDSKEEKDYGRHEEHRESDAEDRDLRGTEGLYRDDDGQYAGAYRSDYGA